MKQQFRNPNIIPTRVLFYMAWKNMTHKKLRAFLTIFGVVIGIGAIFFLLSFGIGLQRLVTNQVIGSQSIKSIDITTSNSKIIKLDDASFTKIRGLPHVLQIGKQYSFAASLRASGSEVDAIVYGQDAGYAAMDRPILNAGRQLDGSRTDQVLLNLSAARAIGIADAKQAVGKKVALHIPLTGTDLPEISANYTIAGVVNTQGGNEMYLPSQVFTGAGVPVISQVKLEADSSTHVANLRKQIESLGFLTTSPVDTVDQINQVFRFFNIVLAGFGAIGMIVAVLGMFNTLTISLLERTKEIGLMVTLGGRNRDMRKLFIFEAILLSVTGATVGIIAAMLLGQVINLALNLFAHHRGVTEHFQLFASPWWLILGMLTFMLVVGLSVVYLPARRAARINPIDALRRE
ncbi:MAG TPA: FtsX-like permease family protein [Candidatus Saccharimonadales bacterium]|nr:FtsX-like permease family protein [Candidatus Saccharimonadales bacterium]